MTSNADIHARYVNALRTQAKAVESPVLAVNSCPWCQPPERLFQTFDQLVQHAKDEHAPHVPEDPTRARARVREEVHKAKALAEKTYSEATAGAASTPDVGKLSLDPARPSVSSVKKRPAESEFQTRRGKISGPIEIYDPDFDRTIPHTIVADRTHRKQPTNLRLYDPKQSPKGAASLYRSTPEPSSDWSVDANRSHAHPPSAHRPLPPPAPAPHGKNHVSTNSKRQRGLIEHERSSAKYPGLFLQPEARAVSQEQLALEIKGIYAGLMMVEQKCIEVDKAQEEALKAAGPGAKPNFTGEQLQAFIALHRTLLHEHHDFFTATQHPAASPAILRLALKHAMPARMWKAGIHDFLELLRRGLPESIDYMLAFICLAYHMVALLYETVPAFEETWMECLGDLARYRMAVEDEDLRDRETWAGVARSWYSKVTDKTPSVGRLYHHLAILSRSNALQQLAYYCRSLACVVPFNSARESILTLLEPVMTRPGAFHFHGAPLDAKFIQAHAILFKRLSDAQFEEAQYAFQSQLGTQIGRITAKWKEQGVYISIANIAGLFDYGSQDSILRQVLLFHFVKVAPERLPKEAPNTGEIDVGHGLISKKKEFVLPTLVESEIPGKMKQLSDDPTFSKAYRLTMTTLSIVLQRIGDKNVLPHAHILLSFLACLASISYVDHLLDNVPWTEIVTFLNILLKSEKPERLFTGSIFPPDQGDNIPLPEDYHMRGQMWNLLYFPDQWFPENHDEEDRYVELASTTRSRTERVLRLGHHLSTFNRWISYDGYLHKFSVPKLNS